MERASPRRRRPNRRRRRLTIMCIGLLRSVVAGSTMQRGGHWESLDEGAFENDLAALVECQYGLKPKRGEEVHVLLGRPGERPVERVVHVFDLPGRASPYRALAWVEHTPDGRERVVTEIHGPDWRSSEAVVRDPAARDSRR